MHSAKGFCSVALPPSLFSIFCQARRKAASAFIFKSLHQASPRSSTPPPPEYHALPLANDAGSILEAAEVGRRPLLSPPASHHRRRDPLPVCTNGGRCVKVGPEGSHGGTRSPMTRSPLSHTSSTWMPSEHPRCLAFPRGHSSMTSQPAEVAFGARKVDESVQGNASLMHRLRRRSCSSTLVLMTEERICFVITTIPRVVVARG